MIIGLDVGSRSSKAVVLSDDFSLRGAFLETNRGSIVEAVRNVLGRALASAGENRAFTLGVTGGGRDGLSFPSEAVLVNDFVALGTGAARGFPKAGSVLDIGAQSSRWLRIGVSEEPGEGVDIEDFALNDKCAAGAGAFLEQQALRLKLSLEEFSDLAASARRGAKVAGRCSVFAKSDMIHLQQKGTPVAEIAYGLCLALARNFESTVLRGKEIVRPAVLAGGGALNPGLRRALREVLGLAEEDCLVGEAPHMICALGAALAAANAAEVSSSGRHREFVGKKGEGEKKSMRLKPLGKAEAGASVDEPLLPADGNFRVYLGADVGSVSTNLALVDEEGMVAAGVYLPTRGRPLEAVKEGYARLVRGFNGRLDILGIGTTGSGRHLAGRFLEADVIRNEITCQLTAALHVEPEVETILEIGGQDSKYISVRNGRIRDFTMNKICAAGTGSFLEEQSGLLKIDIERDFAVKAFASVRPVDLGSRCTVFMDSELADASSRGAPVEDIAAGLAYAVAKNYLEKVVAPRPVGKRILFQGGVASNQAVVRAFSLLLDRPVRVHPHNRISGAIGAALEAAAEAGRGSRTARVTQGDLARRIDREYTVVSFECRRCSNRCEVNRVTFGGRTVFFGDTCERYTALSDTGQSGRPALLEEDLFEERKKILESYLRKTERPTRVGMPRVSYVHEYLPFWAAFFDSLGCDLVLSPESSTDILEAGLKKLPVEACLPVKLAYGHAARLGDLPGLDWVFFPSLTQFEKDQSPEARPCPYGEHMPFMIKEALDIRLIAPTLDFGASRSSLLREMDEVRKALKKSAGEMRTALTRGAQAQREFRNRLRRRGEKYLASAGKQGVLILAVLGKPYNVHDSFVNMNLAKHIARLGAAVVPYDFLPLAEKDSLDRSGILPVWRYNRLMIQAAEWCLKRGDIHPVLVSNFGCGPDAFSQRHLDALLDDRPHLALEFDEHRAEAGLVTRLEAFLDEVGSFRETGLVATAPARPARRLGPQRPEEYRNRRFYLPYISDHIYAFSGAMKAIGLEVSVLSPPDAETVALGEASSSGRECHAYALLAGDLVRLARSGEPEGVYYFPGTQYLCLLQQYGPAMNSLLHDLGVRRMEVVAPPFDFLAQLLGFEGLVVLWRGMVALDLLVKKACSIRPYETCRGMTDRVHRQNLLDIERGLATYSLRQASKQCDLRLSSIDRRSEERPLVGIAGDIYTRQNDLANNDLIRRLEAMGCEVWPAPFFVEQMNFVFGRDLWKHRQAGRPVKAAGLALLDLRRRFERWNVGMGFRERNMRFSEPEYRRVIELADPYLNRENNEIVQLNIAKMADYARRGADGIINVICFNCLLGTISAALSGSLRRDNANIPLTTLVYSGSDTIADRARLEAFVHQVKRFAASRRPPPRPPVPILADEDELFVPGRRTEQPVGGIFPP